MKPKETKNKPKTGTTWLLPALMATLTATIRAASPTPLKVFNPYTNITAKSTVTINFLRDFITTEVNYSTSKVTLQDPTQGSLVGEVAESFSNYQEMKFNTSEHKTNLSQILRLDGSNDALINNNIYLNTQSLPYISAVGITSNSSCFMTNLNKSQDNNAPQYWVFSEIIGSTKEECATGFTLLPPGFGGYSFVGFFDKENAVLRYKAQTTYNWNYNKNKRLQSLNVFSGNAPENAYGYLRAFLIRSTNYDNAVLIYSKIGSLGKNYLVLKPVDNRGSFNQSVSSAFVQYPGKANWMDQALQGNSKVFTFWREKAESAGFEFGVVAASFQDTSQTNSVLNSLFRMINDFYPGMIIDPREYLHQGFYYEVSFPVPNKMLFVKYPNITVDDTLASTTDGYNYLTNGVKNGELRKEVALDFNFKNDEHYLEDVEFWPEYLMFRVVIRSRKDLGFEKSVVFAFDHSYAFGDGNTNGLSFNNSQNRLYHYLPLGIFEVSLDTESQTIGQRLIIGRQFKLNINKPANIEVNTTKIVQLHYDCPGTTGADLTFNITFVKNFEEFEVNHGPGSHSEYTAFQSPYPYQYYLRGLQTKGDFIQFSTLPQNPSSAVYYRAGISAFHTLYDENKMRTAVAYNASSRGVGEQLRGAPQDSLCAYSGYPAWNNGKNKNFAVRCRNKKLASVIINTNNYYDSPLKYYRASKELEVSYLEIPCEAAICTQNGLALISPVPIEQANQTDIGYILLMKNQSVSDEFRVMKTSNFKGLFSGFNPSYKVNYKVFFQQSGEYEGYLAQIADLDQYNDAVNRISRIDLKHPYFYIEPLLDAELSKESTQIEFSNPENNKTQILSFDVSLVKNPNYAPVFIKKRMD